MSARPVRTRIRTRIADFLDPDDEKGRKCTPPPSLLQRAERENWELRRENDHLKTRISYYNDAVRSIVLRLKVLDIEQLKKEMGEDGTIPMRMMLRELINLQKAYDDKVHSASLTDSYSTTPSPAPNGGFY